MGKICLLICLACAGGLMAQWPDKVIATVSTGQHPNDACFSSDGTSAFVAVGYGLLSRISTQSWTVSGVLSLGGTPMCVTTAGNTVLVADEGLDRLLFIDGDSLTVLAERAMAPGPAEFQTSPDGSRVYLSHSGGFVSVIDVQTMEIESVVWVGYQPGGCHVTPDGGTLFIADNQSPEETAFILPEGPVQRFVSGMDSFDCTGAQGKLYFSNPSWGILLRVDQATRQTEGSLGLTGAEPRWMAPIPGTPYMAVVSTSDNTLRIIDTGQFQQSGQIAVGASPQRIRVSPDGAYILVPCRGTGKLYVIGHDPAGVETGGTGFSLRSAGPSGAPAVTLELDRPVCVTVTLHDLAGRTVARLHHGPLPAGVHTFQCPGLPAGVYHAAARGGIEGGCRLTVIR